MNFGPELNNDKNIFVFGANLAGRHGKGAAKEALKFWGAKYGLGEGRQGNAYGIPTKDYNIKTLPLSEIRKYVDKFIIYAKNHPELTFLVTKIGTGLAGHLDTEIAPMFKTSPLNCVLDPFWVQINWRYEDEEIEF